MYYYERTSNLIKEYNKYRKTNDISIFIKETCNYFNLIKEKKLSQKEIKFLYFIANKVGIPQYYYMLNSKFNHQSLEIEDINLLTLESMINDSSLIINNEKLHKYQYKVLNSFNLGLQNRFILTAPTSFGKTFIVYKIIEKMNYHNIILMFPTISLLSENYEKLLILSKKDTFWSKYKIHTLSDDEEMFENNIWVLTPERFLSINDKCNPIKYDFIFIDEIYKIDNEYLIDKEKLVENERDTAYRLALEYSCINSKDILLCGPYLEINNDINKQTNSIQNFIKDKTFKILDFNKIEIVNKVILNVKGRSEYQIDDIKIRINKTSIYSIVASVINAITTEEDNTIVYYCTKAGVERYAKEIAPFLKVIPFTKKKNLSNFYNFIEHLENTFDSNWIVVRSLKNRIGIHHGLVPKYVQKQIIEFFNTGILTVLISTTTITEGVNTTAKNIIICSNKKGKKDLRHFDAMNIAGRAGRFNSHYLGRVIVVKNEFETFYKEKEDSLKHKNYDKNTIKNEIDYLITDDKYLNSNDLKSKAIMYHEVEKRAIPLNIIEQFKVIKISDKLKIYDSINDYSEKDFIKIDNLIKNLNCYKKIRRDGFQLILNTISPIINDQKLNNLISNYCKNNTSSYSILTEIVLQYLNGGFSSVLKYNKERKEIDKAMRDTADLIFSTMKYQLVKYLGAFDLMYKCVKMKKTGKNIEEIHGISTLIKLLEYSVLTKNGRILNDYGVPSKVLKYYENNQKGEKDFDKYESYIDNKISELLE